MGSGILFNFGDVSPLLIGEAVRLIGEVLPDIVGEILNFFINT